MRTRRLPEVLWCGSCGNCWRRLLPLLPLESCVSSLFSHCLRVDGVPWRCVHCSSLPLPVRLGVALPRGVAFSTGRGSCLVFAESWVARGTRCVRLRGFSCEPVRLSRSFFVTPRGSSAAYADTRRSRYKQTLQQPHSSASATVCKVSRPLRTYNVSKTLSVAQQRCSASLLH